MEVSPGEKRPAEGDGGVEARELKKARGGGAVVRESVKKLAEMVLVLAAMGKVRGGRVPSEAERELMAEARKKLAEVCEVFAPKDVFPRDAFGRLIQDLGLNKLKEQRLGFRPPKISIAEKLMFSKRKFQMEKSDELTLPSATSSQRVQGSSDRAVESRGTSNPVRLAPLDKHSHAPPSLQPASALGHASATNSASLPYQLPTSEVKPIASKPLPSNHPVKHSSSINLPRVDRLHFRVDGRTNSSSHPSQVQVQALPPGHQTTLRTPAWSVQPQSVSSNQRGPDNKVPVHASKVEGAVGAKSGMLVQPPISNPLVTQVATANPSAVHQNLQGVNFVRAPPMRNIHAEIGKIVQKFLQPQNRECPTWTPPSRDYMNRALPCQMCHSAVTEVDNVLVCDNCEKAFHLKCLQAANHKGAPRVEWHCLRCLSLSNGKPIPPKYGRVMRNVSAAKMSSNTAAVHPSSDRKAETLDGKANQQKVTANGNIPMQNAPIGSSGNISSQSMLESKLPNAIAMQGNGTLSSSRKMDDKVSSGTYPSNTSSTPHVASSANLCFEGLNGKKPVDFKSTSLDNPDTANQTSDQSKAPGNLQSKDQVQLPSRTGNHLMVNDSMEHYGGETLQNNSNNELKRDEQGVVRFSLTGMATTTSGDTGPAKSSSSCSYAVDWIGDIFQMVDEKTYYQSCRINGVVYKVHDHALVCSDNGKLIPSKLQAMWEDSKTKIKWVTINKCYFPDDLPEAVGRPCGLESNEVYESTCGSMMMAGLIHGPCQVLPPNKFAAERERRARLGTGTNDGLPPYYLCKWIYDESKGLFRDVSC